MRLFEPRVQCEHCSRPIGNQKLKIKSHEYGYETTRTVSKGVEVVTSLGARRIMHRKCATELGYQL